MCAVVVLYVRVSKIKKTTYIYNRHMQWYPPPPPSRRTHVNRKNDFNRRRIILIQRKNIRKKKTDRLLQTLKTYVFLLDAYLRKAHCIQTYHKVQNTHTHMCVYTISYLPSPSSQHTNTGLCRTQKIFQKANNMPCSRSIIIMRPCVRAYVLFSHITRSCVCVHIFLKIFICVFL